MGVERLINFLREESLKRFNEESKKRKEYMQMRLTLPSKAKSRDNLKGKEIR